MVVGPTAGISISSPLESKNNNARITTQDVEILNDMAPPSRSSSCNSKVSNSNSSSKKSSSTSTGAGGGAVVEVQVHRDADAQTSPNLDFLENEVEDQKKEKMIAASRSTAGSLLQAVQAVRNNKNQQEQPEQQQQLYDVPF